MNDVALWMIAIAASYLIGATPVGLLIGKAKGIDLREHGSGNIGATNVVRVLGKRLGLICFALDVAKGAGPVLVSGWLMGTLSAAEVSASAAGWWIGVGIAAIVGHVFPVYLRFRGGKGVATTIGAFAAFWPWMTWPVVIGLLVWYAVVKATRYVSVASMAFGVTLPIAAAALQVAGVPREGAFASGWPFVAAGALLAVFVLWTHRANIARLRRGEENRTRPRVTG